MDRSKNGSPLTYIVVSEAAFKKIDPEFLEFPELDLKVISEDQKRSPEQPRKPSGEWDFRIGKSPKDAMMVVALTNLGHKAGFTLAEYIQAYGSFRNDYPGFWFEGLAGNPETTARNDLAALAPVMLTISNDGPSSVYRLTQSGKDRVNFLDNSERAPILEALIDSMRRGIYLAQKPGIDRDAQTSDNSLHLDIFLTSVFDIETLKLALEYGSGVSNKDWEE